MKMSIGMILELLKAAARMNFWCFVNLHEKNHHLGHMLEVQSEALEAGVMSWYLIFLSSVAG
jgi:hypothetical protein